MDRNATGMTGTTDTNMLSDRVIAWDMLNSAKNGIKSYAWAITETASPDMRNVLRRHLDDTIAIHEKIVRYMMDRGLYHAYDPREMIKLDLKDAETVMNIEL